MIWMIVFAVLVFVIVFLLVTPMTLTIDTTRNRYEARLWGVARVNVVPDEREIVLIRIRTFFMTWRMYPLRPDMHKDTAEKREGSTRIKRKDRRGLRRMPQRMWRMVRSFRITEFRLDLDTGDYVWNAYLYPVFWFLNAAHREMQINFNGRNVLRMQVRNRLIRMLYAFIR